MASPMAYGSSWIWATAMQVQLDLWGGMGSIPHPVQWVKRSCATTVRFLTSVPQGELKKLSIFIMRQWITENFFYDTDSLDIFQWSFNKAIILLKIIFLFK